MKKFKPKSPKVLAWESEHAKLPGLFIPMKTVSEVNRREHHFAQLRRKTAEKLWVSLELRKRERIEPVYAIAPRDLLGFADNGLTVTLTRYSHNTLDDDNLRSALKYVRDEIARWVGVDDGDSRYHWVYKQAPAPHGGYGVRIEFS